MWNARLSQVQLCRSLEEATSDADVVVEAVSENLALKQKLFAELEGYVRPEAILCSNTSAISISLIAEPLESKRTTRGNTLLESAAYCSLRRSNQITLHIRGRVRVHVPVDETDRQTTGKGPAGCPRILGKSDAACPVERSHVFGAAGYSDSGGD